MQIENSPQVDSTWAATAHTSVNDTPKQSRSSLNAIVRGDGGTKHDNRTPHDNNARVEFHGTNDHLKTATAPANDQVSEL